MLLKEHCERHSECATVHAPQQRGRYRTLLHMYDYALYVQFSKQDGGPQRRQHRPDRDCDGKDSSCAPQTLCLLREVFI